MHYPCHYGFVPDVKGKDGDLLDVLLLARAPIVPGAALLVRPIGMLKMEDEHGRDEKVIVVPSAKVDRFYEEFTDISSINSAQRKQIEYFFKHYKDLEEGKFVTVSGLSNREETIAFMRELGE